MGHAPEIREEIPQPTQKETSVGGGGNHRAGNGDPCCLEQKINRFSVLDHVVQARENKVGIVGSRAQQQKKDRGTKSRVRTTAGSPAGLPDTRPPSFPSVGTGNPARNLKPLLVSPCMSCLIPSALQVRQKCGAPEARGEARHLFKGHFPKSHLPRVGQKLLFYCHLPRLPY